MDTHDVTVVRGTDKHIAFTIATSSPGVTGTEPWVLADATYDAVICPTSSGLGWTVLLDVDGDQVQIHLTSALTALFNENLYSYYIIAKYVASGEREYLFGGKIYVRGDRCLT